LNESNIDRLFQITAPRSDWAPPAMHGGVPLPAFSDQLWQLTAPTAPDRPAPESRRESDASPRDDAKGPYDTADPAPRTFAEEEKAATARAPESGRQDVKDEPPTVDSNQTGSSEKQAAASDADLRHDEESDGEDTGAAETANQPPQNKSSQAVADSAVEKLSNASQAAHAVKANARAAQVAEFNEGLSTDAEKGTLIATNAESAGNQLAARSDAQSVSPSTEASELQAKADGQLLEASAEVSSNGSGDDAAVAAIVAGGAEEPVAKAKDTVTAERKVKLPRSLDTADSADVSLREQSPADEKLLMNATESNSGVNDVDGNRRDASNDDRRSVHLKEPVARPVAQNMVAAAANQALATVMNDPAANAGETKAGASEDGRPSSARISGAIGEGLSTALARGQRSGSPAHAREANEPGWRGVDPARFVGRVAKAFHFAQERGGTLQLRLSPPDLGSLRLELTVKDGVMIANMETETPAARRLLLDHLPALRDRLAEQNVRVERFDVDVRRDDQPGHGRHSDASQQQGHEQRNQQQTSAKSLRARHATGVGGMAADAPAAAGTANSTGINLVI
jgi:flagellar hook-length control protein FliK